MNYPIYYAPVYAYVKNQAADNKRNEIQNNI